MQLTIGTDPEVFVRDVNGKYFSGHDLIPGTKQDPYPVKNGAIQVDGVALEFNTRPAKTKEEFTQYIDDVISQLDAEYKTKRPDLTIAITPTAMFDREYFDSLPDEPKELGCTPDYNAYTGGQNEPPSTDEPFRTGSGHIHIGGWCEYENPHDDTHFDRCRRLVRQLDAILYPASLLWDSDDRRRSLYGKIGAFRPKFYGVEYRPLSNAYLAKKSIQELVFGISVKAASDFFNGVVYEEKDFVNILIDKVRNGNLSSNEIEPHLIEMQDTFGSFGLHEEMFCDG